MTKVKVDDKVFVIDEMVKSMESKDIINMVALEIEKASNIYKEKIKADHANKDKRKEDFRKALIAFFDSGADYKEVNDVTQEVLDEADMTEDNSLELLEVLDEILKENLKGLV